MVRMLTRILFVLLLLASPSFAQSVSAQFSGTCRQFDVTVYSDILEGSSSCADIKVDFPGRLLSPNQDSFFYARNAFCSSPTTISVVAETPDSFTAVVRLRLNSTVIESESIAVSQDCPRINDAFALVYASAIIVLLAVAIALYIRR